MVSKKIVAVFFFIITSFSFFGINTMNFQAMSTEVEEVGTYPVIYKYVDPESGKVKEKTIYVTLTRTKTIINQEVGEAIDANDVLVEKGALIDVTDAELIRMTHAKAWSTQTGALIPITSVEFKTVNAAQGVYSARFSTAAGTSVSVQIVEMEGFFITQKDNYMNLTDLKNINKKQIYSIYFLVFLLLVIMALLFIYINRKIDDVEFTLYKEDAQK